MLPHRIVLSLALLTATVSSARAPEDVPLPGAQGIAPLSAPMGPESQEPEQAVSQGESAPYRYTPENETPPALLFPRILAEAGGGVLGGAVMGLAGLLTGAPVLRNVSCSAGKVCVTPLILIMVPAAFVGVPVGVVGFAEVLGGRGRFLPTLGGSLLGTGAGFISGLLSESTGGMVASLIIWPLVGAIAGYEISHVLNQHRALSAGAVSSARSGPRVLPVIGATPRGDFFGGLAGNF